MLIRITRNSEGLEHYLEKGHKKGRDKSRDELDKRVHIGGDLNTFRNAVEYTQNNKKWKDNYFHITASFALENNNLDDETLKNITDDLLDYYFCDYKKEDLIYACEAHKPIFQSEINKSTGEVNQRLLHIHLATSMLDTLTGNQVRMIPYRHEADKAFQSMMAEKYNLVDPANRKRGIKQTKKDIIERWNSNTETTHKQTKVADLRKLFSEVLTDIKDIDDAKELLNNLDIVANVEFKEQKSGNKYLQVKTILDTKNINLRGKGFEHLETLYYSDKELKKRAENGKYKDVDKRTNEEITEQHKAWWVEQQSKRKSKKIDYKKIGDKYENKFKDRIKESRVYYVLYKNNIQEELITGFRIWEKNNTKYLFNNDLGVKVYDRPDKITANIPDDDDARSKTVRLMLEMAVAKGWDLKTLNVTGDIEFKNEVEKQIKTIRDAEEVKLSVRLPEPEKEPESLLNVVKQEVFESKEQDAKKQLSKEEIASIKTELDAQTVIDYAIKNYGLIGEHFSVIDNKINDDRTKAKPKNNIDFLTKNCNVPFCEALPILNELLQEQKQENRGQINMNISVCHSSNPNGLSDWENIQIKTFKELEHAVKNHHYSAVGDLKDNYRKIDNVQSMSNIAIFDIDNDPNTKHLTIEDAQELLKDTTFMIVPSRSHQKEKDGKPAVDRYRVFIPLDKGLTPEKQKYRSEMALIAEKLGLLEYTDSKALNDIARQYYKSPADAQVIINNTKQSFKVDDVIKQSNEQIAEQERIKQEAKDAIKNRIIPSVASEFNTDEFHKIIDIDAMNKLPLDEIYEAYTGQKIKLEGSYLMGKGITPGTSSKKRTFTILEDNNEWIWHDFKTNESGNVLTFMRYAAGLNAFDAAQELEKKFSVQLLIDNPAYYAKALKEALKTATNDKTLILELRLTTQAKIVKIEKNSIKIADKEFSFDQLEISKLDMINQLRANREALKNNDDTDFKPS
jgi:hypothetical protein